jgi:hypothetical protein
MEISSITEIRELKNSIKEQIFAIDKSAYKDSSFGSESEYTYKGLLGGLDCLLTDITTITKAPSQFLKISTFQERQAIVNSLRDIKTYINSPSQLWQYLDNLKKAVRPFHVRYTQERLLDFDNEISELVRKKQVFEEEIRQLVLLKSENEELAQSLKQKNDEMSLLLNNLETTINETDSKSANVIENFSILSTKIVECNTLIQTASNTVETINEQLAEAKSSNSSIQSFESIVDSKQKQADLIDKRTLEYKNKIVEFENEREKLNEKARQTINEAIDALEYNTARGLSASFQTQLEKIESSKYSYWLLGAGFFLFLTIAIGIWIVLSGHSDMSGTIGRLALTPFTITGAIFCANQYIRQKNVIEDYSYKMVLAKSIVGFSEQLKKDSQQNSDEYKDYIKLALSEIHQDPLRKRSKIEKEVDGGIKSGVDIVIETAQKIIGLTKDK